jgi:hypothetical protein
MKAPTRRVLWIALQVAFATAVIAYAAATLAEEWEGTAHRLAGLRADWRAIAAASAAVLGAYTVLVQTWRVMLHAWNATLSFGAAARIWFVSNLGRYIPGKIWQIAAMSVMAKRRGVSPVAATGSSLVVNLASVASGFALVLLTGAGVLRFAVPDGAAGLAGVVSGPVLAMLLLAIALGGLIALPYALPLLARTMTRITGRELELPAVPPRAIWVATAGTAGAWLLYGVAFALFSRALLPAAGPLTAGDLFAYVAVYTSSYLVGYLALFAPGGIGVRESMLLVAMPPLGLATAPEALVIALASRLWLIVLEVAPGLVLLALGAMYRSSDRRDDIAT